MRGLHRASRDKTGPASPVGVIKGWGRINRPTGAGIHYIILPNLRRVVLQQQYRFYRLC